MNDSQQRPVVLIVDDAPTNVKVLADALSEHYRIRVAGNGPDALAAARSEPQPDLVLLDIMMPGMDGYEVCRRLKQDAMTERLPIIFVTAKTAEDDEMLGFALGAVDYVTKPYSLPIVQARVKTHVQLKRQADALEALSLVDCLTQIGNRRRFNDVYAREWRRARREGTPLTMLMIDIDHFKEYNDHHGHGLGDDCLRRIADALAGGIARPGDCLARYGGEEFVVLLPDTDVEGGSAIAEKLRQTVESLGLAHGYSSVNPVVTVSIGYATCRPAGTTMAAAELLRQADEGLYRAKAAGRNRVMCGSAGPMKKGEPET